MAVTHQAGQRPCLQSHLGWCSTPRLPCCRKLPPVPGVEWGPGYAGADLLFKKSHQFISRAGSDAEHPAQLGFEQVTILWPWSHRQRVNCSNPCTSHGCLMQTALLQAAGEHRCPQGWKETSQQELLQPSSPSCPGPSFMSPIRSTLPYATPRPRGVTARSFSCPQRPLPCLRYVSCGLLPFWYLAVQAKKVGHNWSNVGENGGFTCPAYCL